jgi:FkbM family methyltransferase
MNGSSATSATPRPPPTSARLASALLSRLPRGAGDRRAAVALYQRRPRAWSCTTQVLVGGARMELELSDWPQAQAFLLRSYDPETVRFVTSHLPPAGVFLDGGAHVGLVSMQVAMQRPDVSVVAFEPHPGRVLALRRNAERNGARVTVVHAGLSDRAGELPFDLSRHAVLAGAGATIPVVTIDAYLAAHGLPRADVLKLDVEGHELAALRGATAALRDGRVGAVTIEAMLDGGPAMRLLEELGFARVALPDLRPGWIARRRPYEAHENAGYVRE